MTPSPQYYRKVHGENPRDYRGYHGITAVPITVQLSNLLLCNSIIVCNVYVSYKVHTSFS